MISYRMPYSNSPLRYPGGKTVLTGFLAEVMKANGLEGGTYVEPYAGGAGAALNLLFMGVASRIYLNDVDLAIYAIWKSILDDTEAFLRRLHQVQVSVEEWRHQKLILQNPCEYNLIDLGFAAFYLNRANHSGILAANPIGGLEQTGKWKIDARFNKSDLAERIERIAQQKMKIYVYNKDALDFLKMLRVKNALVNLDPPYYKKGEQLYINAYCHSDHQELARYMSSNKTYKWIMTYDNTPEIRELYADQHCIDDYAINYYTSRKNKKGKEILIFPRSQPMPSEMNLTYKRAC